MRLKVLPLVLLSLSFSWAPAHGFEANVTYACVTEDSGVARADPTKRGTWEGAPRSFTVRIEPCRVEACIEGPDGRDLTVRTSGLREVPEGLLRWLPGVRSPQYNVYNSPYGETLLLADNSRFHYGTLAVGTIGDGPAAPTWFLASGSCFPVN